MKKRAHKSVRRLFRSPGDTIIEVLLAVTVISAVLIGAFAVVQQSFQGVRSGQEQSEVAQILQAQVEQVRSMAQQETDDMSGVFSTLPRYFCINPATGVRTNFDPGFNLGTLDADDFTMYPTACSTIAGYYNVAVTYDSGQGTFRFSARWDRIGGGRNQVLLSYRVYPGTPIAAAAHACSSNNDVAMVLDSSSSMNTNWQTGTRSAKLEEVARRFLGDTSFAAGQNHGAVIQFNNTARTLQNLTGNAGLLQNAIGNMTIANGTVYTAALNEAGSVLTGSQGRPTAKKIIIFISDGEPREPTAGIYSLSDNLKAQGYAIFAIAINTNTTAKDIMRELSGGPGGGYAPADSEADLDRVLRELSDELSCR